MVQVEQSSAVCLPVYPDSSVWTEWPLTYKVGQKSGATDSWTQFCQIWTDLQTIYEIQIDQGIFQWIF